MTDQEKEMQKQAIRIREWLKSPNTTKDEIAKWYKDEKAKREDEAKMQRRTLNNPKGLIETTHQEGVIDDAIMGWQTYVQFSMEKMILKEATCPEDC